MASQQQGRPFSRLGSFRPMQTAPQRPPPPTPAPQPSIVRPAVPRFRTPATQTSPSQETGQTAPPRQIGAPPPTTILRATVVQSLNSSPAPIPTATTSTPSSPRPVVASATLTGSVPLVRPPPTQPNLATSKPVSPQPRNMASSIPSSPTTKTEAAMKSSPLQAATPQIVSSSRFLADKSPINNSTPQSPVGLQPKTIPPPVTSASPTRESSALQNSFIKKSYPDPSTTPTITSPVRKVPAPSPKSETVLGSHSPPPSEPLPTAKPASIVPQRGHTPASSPRNGTMLYRTPPQSPLVRPLTHPPSPLTLPPAQTKTEIYHEPNTAPKHQTTVMTQERSGKPNGMPRVSDSYELTGTTNKYLDQDGGGKDLSKKNTEAEQSGMRIVRLAGQNHGAIMELSPSRTKGNHNGWTNGRKTGMEYGNGNEEESSNITNDKTMTIQAPHVTAFMNSNVQGMNNSIVYNTSFNHNDPGVHFSFSKKPNGGYQRTT